jgi:hypothetical protein
MSEVQTEITGVEIPAEEKKIFFRYQPKYPEGHELAGQAMGGEQVIEYDGTAEDLGQKLSENNNLIQAELRNLKRQMTVDHPTADEEEIPATATKRSARGAAIQPRDLAPEELLEFSRSIIDPAKAQAALDKAIEARLGVSPARLRSFDEGIQQTKDFIEGNKFRQLHPREANDSATREAMLKWCDARDLDYTCENFELALTRLKKAGLLSEAPIAAEPQEKSQPAPVPEADSSEPERPRRPVTTSSALNNRNSSSGDRRPVQRGGPTWQDIETLSVQQLSAKPPEWKKQATMLFRRLPSNELERKLRTMQTKLDALG